MKAAQTTSSATIRERIHRIHLRVYLEEFSGIPAANKEAFLELCLRYEQKDQLDLACWNNCRQDRQYKRSNLIGWHASGDWNKYEPDYRR